MLIITFSILKRWVNRMFQGWDRELGSGYGQGFPDSDVTGILRICLCKAQGSQESKLSTLQVNISEENRIDNKSEEAQKSRTKMWITFVVAVGNENS